MPPAVCLVQCVTVCCEKDKTDPPGSVSLLAQRCPSDHLQATPHGSPVCRFLWHWLGLVSTLWQRLHLLSRSGRGRTLSAGFGCPSEEVDNSTGLSASTIPAPPGIVEYGEEIVEVQWRRREAKGMAAWDCYASFTSEVAPACSRNCVSTLLFSWLRWRTGATNLPLIQMHCGSTCINTRGPLAASSRNSG